jgi:hypothetical protein
MELEPNDDSCVAAAVKSGRWAIRIIVGLAFVPIVLLLPLELAVLPYFVVFQIAPIAFLTAVAVGIIVKFARRRSWWTGIVRAIQAGIICTAVMSLSIFFVRGADLNTGGFWVYMKLAADVGDIRAWAGSSPDIAPPDGRETHEGRRGLISVHSDNWPPCVRRLHPQYVSLNPKTGRVSLAWGSGHGHWGMDIVQLGAADGPRPGLTLEKGATVWWRE